MMDVAYVPLSEYLSEELWPAGFLTPGSAGFLDDIAWVDGELSGADDSIFANVRLRVMREVSFDLPAGLAVIVGSGDVSATFDASEEGWYVRLATEVLKLRLPRALFRPVIERDGVYKVDPDPAHHVDLAIPFAVTFDSAGNFDVEWPGEGESQLDLPPCMIGDSGVVVEASDVGGRFSAESRLPEAAFAAGLPDDWTGLYFAEAAVHLPEGFGSAVPDDVTMTGCFIGTGGFTGSVSLDWTPAFSGTLFGVTFRLAHFGMSFVQNAVTSSDIRGELTLPFFDAPVAVMIGIEMGGGFTVAVIGAGAGGLHTVEKTGVCRLTLDSLGFELDDGTFLARLSGRLTPTFGGGSITWPTVTVRDLCIDSDGHVKIAGGWLDLSSPSSFELYGFRAEVSRIGFGTEDDGTRWIGLSATMQFVESFAMGGSVEGLKIKWKDGDVSLELRGIGVELLIPNTLYLNGKLQLIDEGPRTGFKGGVQLRVIPTNLAIDAQLLVGRNSESPAFTFAYIFVAAELPVGIPILNTGLSFYGFAGLVGYNVAPAKGPHDPWFDGWYLKPPVGVADVGKWRDERDAFALGVGTTIGTASDNGYAFHGKFLLVLVLPGPLILLDGQAAFLQARGSGEPNFLSLAIFDGRAGTLLFNVQAHYAYTETGDLIDITGFAEAFFDFASAKKWHLYLGMDTPDSKRIRAAIIQLFEANSYFMLNHSGVRMGAWFGLDRKWKYGPLKVTLDAWIEGAAAVSWAPTQLEGSLALQGDVGLKAFGAGASLSLYSLLEAKAPHPYRVHAEFRVKMNLPWPLPDPKAKVKLTWEEELPPPPPRPLEVLGVEHLKVSEKWLMASSPGDAPVVPLDARPVLSFQRRMTDHTNLASNALPSSSERVGGYRFRYFLEEIRLEKRASAGEAWVDATTPPTPSLPAGNLWTTWQAVSSTSSDAAPQGVPPMTKLMIWSRTPFDYGRETPGAAVQDGFLDENPAWPCGYDWTPMAECVEFEERPLGPMPPFSVSGRAVIAARHAQVVKWGTDWIPVKQAAVIATKTNVETRLADSPEPEPTRLSDSPPHAAVARQQEPAMRIVFPSHAAAASLYVGRGTKGVLLQPGRPARAITDEQKPIDVDAGPENLTYVDLVGVVVLLRVCWVAREEWDRTREGLASAVALGSNAADALAATAELLQPHRQYRLTARTVVERSGNGGSSWTNVGSFTDTGYFQTQGPPGLVAATGAEMVPSEDSEHYPASGPLKDLTAYVHRTVPCEGGRPVYRAYDVGVEFNDSYVEAMYALDGTPLVLQLRDSNGAPVSDASGEPLNLMAQWRPLEAEQLGEVARQEEAAWLRRLAATACAEVAGATPPEAKSMSAGHPRLLLAPDTIYRALLGPLRPAAVVPLAVDGTIARTAGGQPVVMELTGSTSDRLGQIASSSEGNKLLIGPHVVAEASLGSQEGVHAFDAGNINELAVLKSLMLELAPPPQTLARVYDWTFTTSRFATFVHQIQSFRDATRRLYEERGQPVGDLLTPEQLTWLEGIVAALPLGVPAIADSPERQLQRDQEGHQFDRVLAELGLARALPTVVEVTLLDDANRSYGLLIESPEPFAWERIHLSARRRATPVESVLTPAAPVKLTAASFAASDASADLVKEFVDIAVLESVNVHGLKVQVHDDLGGWQDYYVFGGEAKPAGSLMRVHTGSVSDDLNPIPEVDHSYARDAGGAAQRRFGDSITRVRLLDGAGQPLHERTFLASTFATRVFRLLRSRDGTRVMLFLRTAATPVASVPTGTIRLSWTFRRNIMPEEPILRRMGSDRDEATSIDIVVP
jgi:hypothetical protein